MNNNSKNFLTYSIATERLYGTVGGQEFSMHAWSGGGRGQTGDSAEHNLASYDVSRKTKNKKNIRGGPLPPGHYVCDYIAKHKKFGECISLKALADALFTLDANSNPHFYNRDGFFIHGRGPHGSDGCIVPISNTERLRLNQAIKGASITVTLKVIDPGMPLPAVLDTLNKIG